MRLLTFILAFMLVVELHAQQACATPPSLVPLPAGALEAPAGIDYCAHLYLEVDYDIVVDKGGESGAINYVDGLMNQVVSLYAADGITITYEAYYWTVPSPYVSGSSWQMLSQFRTNRPVHPGDFAMLISYKSSGGIAFVDQLCSSNFGYSFSSIQPSYKNYPEYSWSVMVCAHEMGHTLGSPHTQSCVWNGNNTPIDGCYPAEGDCGTAPVPVDGGTVMSYCHLRATGINLLKGFGPQPAAVIKNRIAGANCVECQEDGEPDEPETYCGEGLNEVRVDVLMDHYPREFTWEIKDHNGERVAGRDFYPKNSLNVITSDTVCLPDGCYTFVALDSEGDGLCCNTVYGEGMYSVTFGENEVASGADFGDRKITEICINDEPDRDECPAFDLSSIVSYGTNQDNGVVFIEDGGNQITLRGNSWKSIEVDYTVTDNTFLEFDFKGNIEGEIHAIGLDDNNVISSNRSFRLWGTQNWGLYEYDNYEAGEGWKTYTIPVSDFYYGTYSKLFFTNDKDQGVQDAESSFKNVRLFEAPCNGEAVFLTPKLGRSPKAGIYPNPSDGFFTVNMDESGPWVLINSVGEVINNGVCDTIGPASIDTKGYHGFLIFASQTDEGMVVYKVISN
jgi:hypothetical protein